MRILIAEDDQVLADGLALSRYLAPARTRAAAPHSTSAAA